MPKNPDPLVVRTFELSEVLAKWCREHDALISDSRTTEWRPSHRYESEPDLLLGSFTASQYIAYHSKLHDKAISRILKVEYKFTELRIADAILTAIDEQMALVDGRIETLPNPQWNQERWFKWKEDQGTCI